MPTLRFFLDTALQTNLSLALPEHLSRRLTKVLRLSHNSTIELFNRQALATATLKIASGTVSAVLQDIQPLPQPKIHIELGQIMPKQDKMEFIIEKATELGVANITPLTGSFCEVKLDSTKAIRKLQKWNNLVIAALEQSESNTITQVLPVLPVQQWIQNCTAELKLILNARDKSAIKIQPDLSPHTPQSIAILIGCEGGIADNENKLALEKGFIPITLGDNILRAETAPLVATALVQNTWNWR
jgi:16S rRNA (uracil1498-N3)-methyltransferase